MRRLTLCILLGLSHMGAPHGVQAQIPESEMKAALVYNFIHFTQWPEKNSPGAALNLCAAPESPLYSSLLKLSGRSAQGREINVVPLQNAGVGDCNVIMVSGEDNKRTSHIRKLLSTGAVLGITDDPAALPGDVMIVMAVENNRMIFSINNTKANAAGIFVSSRLLRLARSVQ